ncbi:organomercurial lyase [Streptomyces wedmorensis]
MCAIDALGVSAMLGQDVTVSSTDPVDGQLVTVTDTDGAVTWEPAEAVVFVGRREGEGPAAEVCCDALDFFSSWVSTVQRHLAHAELRGEIVRQARAVRTGRRTFGPLLQTGDATMERLRRWGVKSS